MNRINKTVFGSQAWSHNSVVGAGGGGGPKSKHSHLAMLLAPLCRTASGTFKSYYDDPTVAGGGGGDTIVGGSGNDTVAGGGGGGGSGGGNPPKVFHQADIDRILAKERREYQEKAKKQADELEALKKNFTGTAEEKQRLESQIEELRTSSLTKEQQLQRQLEKEKKEREEAATTLAKERDSWLTRHNTLLAKQKLTEASSSNDAFSPQQIIDLLLPRAKVVEAKDGEGNPTGDYNIVIRFDDVDTKTKQPVTLELEPDAALKRMKELPDRFGNLFKSNLQGGVGKNKTTPAGTPDIASMSMEEYAKYRKAQKQG